MEKGPSFLPHNQSAKVLQPTIYIGHSRTRTLAALIAFASSSAGFGQSAFVWSYAVSIFLG